MHLRITEAEKQAFIEQYAEKLRADQAKRDAFQKGPVFASMLSALRDAQGPVSVSGDDLGYHLQQTKAAVGWQSVSDDDVSLFISLVVNPDAPTVDKSKITSDPDCTFYNYSFPHFGLYVWMMIGQGTAFVIRNEAAQKERQQDVVEQVTVTK